MHSRYVYFISQFEEVKRMCIYDLLALVCIIFTSFIFSPCLCWADFYSYRDKNGVMHFTDNLADIPEEQQDKIRIYQEVSSPTTLEQKPFKRPAEEAESKPEAPPKDIKDPSLFESLNSSKASLDMERSQLEKELAELVEKELKFRRKIAVRAHNLRMQEYIERFSEYKKKRSDFETNWVNYYSFLKNSSEYIKLNSDRTALHMERNQLEKELTELVEKGQKLKTKMAARVHKLEMKKFISRFRIYQINRDSFEDNWYDFFSSQ